jgi:hypothetical protein
MHKPMIAGVLVLVGGALLLFQSLFGLFAIMMLGFDSFLDWTTALSLTLAFPVYLVGLKSLRLSTGLLWLFFLAQWINKCFLSGSPKLANPFDGWHGETLLVAILAVQVGYLLFSRTPERQGAVTFRDMFARHL